MIDEYEIRECVYEQDGKVAKRENIRGKTAPCAGALQHAHRTDTKTHRHKDENMHTRRLTRRPELKES